MSPILELEAGNAEETLRLFRAPCRFMRGARDPCDLPPADLPEVALWGRSNVGKSSLLNALVGQKALARVSKTPGRTQEINFFDLGGRLCLVDLPGYGHAEAPRGELARWRDLSQAYLRGRPTLRRLMLLIDARHGLKPIDHARMDLLGQAAVVHQIVLTKTDALKPGEADPLARAIAASLARRPAVFPEVLATSARRSEGIEALRAAMLPLARETRS